MPNCAPEEAAVVTLPASVSANSTTIPGPATAKNRRIPLPLRPARDPRRDASAGYGRFGPSRQHILLCARTGIRHPFNAI